MSMVAHLEKPVHSDSLPENPLDHRLEIGRWESSNAIFATMYDPSKQKDIVFYDRNALREFIGSRFEHEGSAKVSMRLSEQGVTLRISRKVLSSATDDIEGPVTRFERTLHISLPRDRIMVQRVSAWLLGDGRFPGMYNPESRGNITDTFEAWDRQLRFMHQSGSADSGEKHFVTKAAGKFIDTLLTRITDLGLRGTPEPRLQKQLPASHTPEPLYKRQATSLEKYRATPADGPVVAMHRTDVHPSLIIKSVEMQERQHAPADPAPKTAVHSVAPQSTGAAMSATAGAVPRSLTQNKQAMPKRVPVMPQGRKPAWLEEFETILGAVREGLAEGATAMSLTRVTETGKSLLRFLGNACGNLVGKQRLDDQFLRYEHGVFHDKIQRLDPQNTAFSRWAKVDLWKRIQRIFSQAAALKSVRERVVALFSNTLQRLRPKVERAPLMNDTGPTAEKRLENAVRSMKGHVATAEEKAAPIRYAIINGKHIQTLSGMEKTIEAHTTPPGMPESTTPPKKGLLTRVREAWQWLVTPR